MSLSFEVARANPLVSVQDRGRRGAMRYGVSQSGPMDWVRFALALRLAGAEADVAFEVGVAGAAFRVTGGEGAVRLAVTGPGFSARVGECTWQAPVTLSLAAGERLDVVPGPSGMWAYLAVAGIDWGEPVLGSHATNVRTGLGARDLSQPLACRPSPPAAPGLWADVAGEGGPIGLLPGPQHHLFADAVHRQMAAEPYRLTAEVDRMGYKLEGLALPAAGGHDIISDGIVEGAVQVPGNAQPIVLCADRAPTGGYPKIAIVAAADRPALTQCRPGAEVRFRWTAVEDARRRRRALAERAAAPVARVRTEFPPEFLAEQNLIGGVWPTP